MMKLTQLPEQIPGLTTRRDRNRRCCMSGGNRDSDLSDSINSEEGKENIKELICMRGF